MIKKLIFSLCFFFFAIFASGALAAEIVNLDGEEHVITITENGVRADYVLSANGTLAVCENGCFVLFPSQTMLFLDGSEKIDIEKGEAIVK